MGFCLFHVLFSFSGFLPYVLLFTYLYIIIYYCFPLVVIIACNMTCAFLDSLIFLLGLYILYAIFIVCRQLYVID